MIFSKRKVTTAYTVAKCEKCGAMQKRRFAKGDVLFADSKCDSCGGTASIDKIFGETIEQ